MSTPIFHFLAFALLLIVSGAAGASIRAQCLTGCGAVAQKDTVNLADCHESCKAEYQYLNDVGSFCTARCENDASPFTTAEEVRSDHDGCVLHCLPPALLLAVIFRGGGTVMLVTMGVVFFGRGIARYGRCGVGGPWALYAWLFYALAALLFTFVWAEPVEDEGLKLAFALSSMMSILCQGMGELRVSLQQQLAPLEAADEPYLPEMEEAAQVTDAVALLGMLAKDLEVANSAFDDSNWLLKLTNHSCITAPFQSSMFALPTPLFHFLSSGLLLLVCGAASSSIRAQCLGKCHSHSQEMEEALSGCMQSCKADFAHVNDVQTLCSSRCAKETPPYATFDHIAKEHLLCGLNCYPRGWFISVMFQGGATIVVIAMGMVFVGRIISRHGRSSLSGPWVLYAWIFYSLAVILFKLGWREPVEEMGLKFACALAALLSILCQAMAEVGGSLQRQSLPQDHVGEAHQVILVPVMGHEDLVDKTKHELVVLVLELRATCAAQAVQLSKRRAPAAEVRHAILGAGERIGVVAKGMAREVSEASRLWEWRNQREGSSAQLRNPWEWANRPCVTAPFRSSTNAQPTPLFHFLVFGMLLIISGAAGASIRAQCLSRCHNASQALEEILAECVESCKSDNMLLNGVQGICAARCANDVPPHTTFDRIWKDHDVCSKGCMPPSLLLALIFRGGGAFVVITMGLVFLGRIQGGALGGAWAIYACLFYALSFFLIGFVCLGPVEDVGLMLAYVLAAVLSILCQGMGELFVSLQLQPLSEEGPAEEGLQPEIVGALKLSPSSVEVPLSSAGSARRESTNSKGSELQGLVEGALPIEAHPA